MFVFPWNFFLIEFGNGENNLSGHRIRRILVLKGFNCFQYPLIKVSSINTLSLYHIDENFKK